MPTVEIRSALQRPGSIPDIVAETQATLIREVTASRHLAVGRGTRRERPVQSGTEWWHGVGFVNPAGTLKEPRRDPDFYVRRGQIRLSGCGATDPGELDSELIHSERLT